LLEPVDIWAGYPSGMRPAVTMPPSAAHPSAAVRDALRRALRHSPCLVAFSGGRDSSVLLAMAADVAARDGLAAPVALTLRYPGDAPATESEWQELVVGHLRERKLPVEWERRDISDELDLVGPLAAPVLLGHRAPVFPAAIAPTVLLTSLAAGGALVTGNFGDEVLGGHRAALLRAVWRRRGRRMTRSDWYLAATAAAPGPARARLLRAGVPELPWLRQPLRDEVRAQQVADAMARPLAWDASVHAALRPRAVALGTAARNVIAAERDCHLVEPFGEPPVVAALARHGGRYGRLSRAAAVRLLAGELLPAALPGRTGKAYFNRSRFGPISRAFATSWTGAGVDTDFVDPDVLRAMWLADEPPAGTALLLQQVWLASNGGRE
jgi:asparagine synthase (glutamine-hydrolysing)